MKEVQSDGLSKHHAEIARNNLIYTHLSTDEREIAWLALSRLRDAKQLSLQVCGKQAHR